MNGLQPIETFTMRNSPKIRCANPLSVCSLPRMTSPGSSSPAKTSKLRHRWP